MAAVALAATVASSVVGAVGGIYGGMSQAAMYNYQAAVARQNAAYETALGEQQAQQQGMKTRAVISQTRATQGAGGLDVNAGSNVQVQASEAELGSYDQAIIRNNAARRAYSYEAQAGLDEAAAKTSKTAGYLDAFTSILGGAGSFADKWSRFKSAGVDPFSMSF